MDLTGVRWDAVTEISLRTTARGPVEEDVFFVFTYDEGAPLAIGLGDSDYMLPRRRQCRGSTTRHSSGPWPPAKKARGSCGSAD